MDDESFQKFLADASEKNALMERKLDFIGVFAIVMFAILSIILSITVNVFMGVMIGLYGLLDFSATRRYRRVMKKERELDALSAQLAHTTVSLGLGQDVFFVQMHDGENIDQAMEAVRQVPGVAAIGTVRRAGP